MGQFFFDQFSLLHFAVGIIAYFWGFSLFFTVIVHILFELLENTKYGMYFINHYVPFWPGGKPFADSMINQISDTLMSTVGWIMAQLADKYSKEKHLYP